MRRPAALIALRRRMSGSVDEAVGSLVARVERLSSGIDDSTVRLGKYAESIDGIATVVTSSSEQLRQSSESLSEATGPIRDSITDIEASTQSMRETSSRTESILRHSHEVIEAFPCRGAGRAAFVAPLRD